MGRPLSVLEVRLRESVFVGLCRDVGLPADVGAPRLGRPQQLLARIDEERDGRAVVVWDSDVGACCSGGKPPQARTSAEAAPFLLRTTGLANTLNRLALGHSKGPRGKLSKVCARLCGQGGRRVITPTPWPGRAPAGKAQAPAELGAARARP
ncbi:unnamed protein product [Amoebophrya sp. A120]|nr:unnamed protein product [Amoebophrya sp. A120]|eukprot:GSA120T00024033001.1